MDKFVIYVRNAGYYTGKIFKYTNENKEYIIYPDTKKDPKKSKQYTSYNMALMVMESLNRKCGDSISNVKNLSDCEVIAE